MFRDVVDSVDTTEYHLGSIGTFHCCRIGFVGFVELLGFVEFVGFVELLGFVELGPEIFDEAGIHFRHCFRLFINFFKNLFRDITLIKSYI